MTREAMLTLLGSYCFFGFLIGREFTLNQPSIHKNSFLLQICMPQILILKGWRPKWHTYPLLSLSVLLILKGLGIHWWRIQTNGWKQNTQLCWSSLCHQPYVYHVIRFKNKDIKTILFNWVDDKWNNMQKYTYVFEELKVPQKPSHCINNIQNPPHISEKPKVLLKLSHWTNTIHKSSCWGAEYSLKSIWLCK